MTSGYANANNEKLLGGNRHYHSADVTINNLAALTTNIDLEAVKSVLDKYNLYVPNTEELFDYILECTRNYWRWPEKEQLIKEFLFKCTREERACIAYIYDLHAMKKFNEDFMYEFIGKLSEKVERIPGLELEEAGQIFNSALDEIKIHAIQVHSDKVIGERESEYVKTETVLDMASQVINTYHVFQEYKDYIQTFLRSRHLPSSLAMLPAILRKVVLMSDTDSSIFTTEAWTKWYTNKSRGFKDKQLSTGVYSAMVMLSSLTLKHLLATMSANLGVPEKYIWGIAMKNEFNFVIFVNLNRTKHYIATIAIQEGNVYSELDIEKKGVHMRNSNSPQDIIKHAEQIMERLYNFHSDEKIRVLDILKEVADAERKRAMAECGIGTPATRANIIETLFKRGYIVKEKRSQIHATETGRQLIKLINYDLLKSAALTGEWEYKLRQIERRELETQVFIDDLKAMLYQLVQSVLAPQPAPAPQPAAPTLPVDTGVPCPQCQQGTLLRGRAAFGCSAFREGCTFRLSYEECPSTASSEELSDQLGDAPRLF